MAKFLAMPSILPALLFTCLACIPFSRRIKKNPIVFYAIFGGCAFLSCLPFLKCFPAIWAIIQLFSSCYTGVAFYLAVMFAGAIPKSWQVTKRLLSIRSEMSIAGGFVIFAHCVRVAFMVPLSFSSYWGSIWSEAAMPMLIACGIVGPALLICFMVSWVTSFPFVRKNMSFKTWKKTQRLAYPFMALLVLQGFLLAVGHGVYVGVGSADSVRYAATALTYLTIGVMYLVLKICGVGAKGNKEEKNA